MGLRERIALRSGSFGESRKTWAEPPFWAQPEGLAWSSADPTREHITSDYESLVENCLNASAPVWASYSRRAQVFSQARVAWQQMVNGRPGRFFGTPELGLFERPWPSGTFGELLTRMEADATVAGNSFWTKADNAGRLGSAARGDGLRLTRLRPDWVTLVVASSDPEDALAPDARVVAFSYLPARMKAQQATILLPTEVAHYSPWPDPEARFRGQSWLTPVIREIEADTAATRHKASFFKNGATPAMLMKLPAGTPQPVVDAAKKAWDQSHSGEGRAYKTAFVAGADIVPMTFDFKQLDFKVTQGTGETRIASAAGVPAAILGISEGLGGSSLNAGNLSSLRRLFVDTTIRDLWSKVAPALEVLLPPPAPGVRLWVDDRDIPFLREDAADSSAQRQADATTLRTLVEAGWDADAAIEFVRTSEPGVLTGQHSGLLSVQLQKPGTGGTPA